MIKAVTFDCFGVITEDGWLTFLNHYGTEENYEKLGKLNRQMDLGLLIHHDFIDAVSEVADVSFETALEVISLKHQLNQPLIELIKTLKQNYKIGMISNIGSNRLNEFLPESVITLFDAITLSCDVGFLKPQPEIYQKYLAKLGVAADEVVFVDDREENCAGARTVGMRAICYRNFEQLETELTLLNIIS